MHERGQTNLDFAIGVSILLVTVIAAVTFIPGLFSAVDEGRADADEVAAHRLASSLVEGQLGHPGSPNRIDADCTVDALVPGSGPTNGSGCDVGGGYAPLTDRRYYNITLRNEDGVACWDENGGNASGGWFDTAGSSDCNEQLTTGNTTTSSSDVAVARRPVIVDGYDATMIVRVW